MRLYRQGDVLFREVATIPEGAKLKGNKVVAEGEVTGHKHQFPPDSQVQLYQLDSRLYAHVSVPTPIEHEKHDDIIIEKGEYEIVPEKEFDYYENDLRKVVD